MANTYIALFRGINVGKAKRISMAELRQLFEGIGYGNVQTVLNSGNVVYTAARPADNARTRIEKALSDEIGVHAKATVISAAELHDVVEDDPLLGIVDNSSRHLVAFLQKVADRAKLQPLANRDWGNEAIAVGKRVAYLWCPNGVLASQVADVVNRTLGDAVTMRNWTTVQKLHALAKPLSC